jgi:hypothetical protein
MHIPVVFDDEHGIGPDDNAEIHFPKDQVPGLTHTLERMSKPTGSSPSSSDSHRWRGRRQSREQSSPRAAGAAACEGLH